VLDFAFDEVGLLEVIAHTTARNERSRAVMRRLGMSHAPTTTLTGTGTPSGIPTADSFYTGTWRRSGVPTA
jgi:RimJ/RimL family protein N-acetyltransferase